jgi:hypothetical protein
MAPRSSIPPRQKVKPANDLGAGLQQALGGLTETLGGVVGGLGKTVGGLTQAVTGTVEGLLGQLLAPLQQLQKQAQAGDEKSIQTYDKAVNMLRSSSNQGNQDAEDLLRQLGEALDQPMSDEKDKYDA